MIVIPCDTKRAPFKILNHPRVLSLFCHFKNQTSVQRVKTSTSKIAFFQTRNGTPINGRSPSNAGCLSVQSRWPKIGPRHRMDVRNTRRFFPWAPHWTSVPRKLMNRGTRKPGPWPWFRPNGGKSLPNPGANIAYTVGWCYPDPRGVIGQGHCRYQTFADTLWMGHGRNES